MRCARYGASHLRTYRPPSSPGVLRYAAEFLIALGLVLLIAGAP